MIQTHLLPLQPPYNYIYYGGVVGKQIATLVAVVDKTNADGMYGLETHSHPMVMYNGRAANGVVWDMCEVKDCSLVCSETEKTITLERFNELLAASEYGSSSPTVLLSGLILENIVLALPEHKEGEKLHFKIYLYFDRTDHFEVFCDPHQPLFFGVVCTNEDDVINELRAQLYCWRQVLKGMDFTVEFSGECLFEEFEDHLMTQDEMTHIMEHLNKAI